MGNVVAAANVHISGMYSVHVHVCMCTSVYISYVYMCVHIICVHVCTLSYNMCTCVYKYIHLIITIATVYSGFSTFPESSWTNIAS